MSELDKKSLTEQDIRTKFITPALVAGDKWDVMNQIREEVYFTKGRVIVRGQLSTRGEPKKADYLLPQTAQRFLDALLSAEELCLEHYKKALKSSEK